jgi:DNA-directed RNA polymerase omega subunit
MNDAYLEKALEKIPDRQALIVLASRRAESLAKGERPMVKSEENCHLDTALLEIAEGLLSYELPTEEKEELL